MCVCVGRYCELLSAVDVTNIVCGVCVCVCVCVCVTRYVKVKIKFTLGQATKSQRGTVV